MTHKCYSCYKIVKFDDLSYECMCFNDDIDAKYRGICKECENIAESEWKEIPDPKHHRLEKIYKISKDVEDYWKMVEEKAPNWGSMTAVDSPNFDDKSQHYQFNYYMGPEGQTGQVFYKWLSEQPKMESPWVFSDTHDKTLPEYDGFSQYRKSVILPGPPSA